MHVGLTRFSGSTNVARNPLSGKDCSQVRQVSNSSPVPSCPASPQPLYSRRPPEEGGPSSPDAHSSSSKHAQVHIGQNDDAAAAPQPQPGELEPSKVCCATLAFALAARHLDQRRNSSDSLVVGMTKRECLISTACIQHVYAAKSWPSLASLTTCCLKSRKAAAWRMLASVAAGMSIPGSLRSIRGHPSQYTRSPLE